MKVKNRYTGTLTIVDPEGNVETSRFKERKSKGDLHFLSVIVKTFNTWADLVGLKNGEIIKVGYEGDFADVVERMFEDFKAGKQPWMPILSWTKDALK